MRTSIIIRSRDEAPRLRLTLASLECQDALDEVLVVDDGSIDETSAVLANAARTLPLIAIRHDRSQGRSAASNAGALAASGDILVFLDGDTLAGPGMVAAHTALHRDGPATIARGETWHLRCTRMLADPETGRFWPADAERGKALPETERQARRVTRAQISTDFDAIARRGAPGVYPGAAPRRLHEEEMRALGQARIDAPLWAAASGSNLSLPRIAFVEAGGFDPDLDINEHRELAYRLCANGARMAAAAGARTYHLTHRSGWRDPLTETAWERRFLARHPHAPIAALKAYWAGISGAAPATGFFTA